MSTFSVEVVELDEVIRHDNADTLDIVKIGGYQAIVGRDQFRAGDVAVYLPEAALVPEAILETMGLVGKLSGSQKNRIKPLRLRGTFSEGLVLSLPKLFDLLHTNEDMKARFIEQYPDDYSKDEDFEGFIVRPGMELRDILGIQKWEPSLPANLRGRATNRPAWLPVYDLENIKKYNRAFKEGEEVVLTEKIHGCFPYQTRILLADGTHALIGKLVNEGFRGEVLGVDERGRVVPTPVVATHNNGTTDTWLKVSFNRRGAGRGASRGALTLTPEHRVFSPAHPEADGEGYVRANQLRAGDKILIHRSEAILPPFIRQVLTGKLLGDGCLNISKDGATADVGFSHSEAQQNYVEHTLMMLGSFAGNKQKSQTSGYGSTMHRARSIRSTQIADAFRAWSSPEGKQVPREAITDITPVAMAFWYMDDGSLGHRYDQEDRANFSTNGFNEQSIDIIIEALNRYGIKGVKHDNGDGWRIRLNADEADKFFLLIERYIPESMRYKLPERYRHLSGSALPPLDYKPWLVEQEVETVEEVATGSRGNGTRYDLTTGTGNFFANQVLVHNCNAAYAMRAEDGKLLVASRKWVLEEPNIGDDINVYWEIAYQEDMREALEHLLIRTGAEYVIVWGEIFGSGVQDLTYGMSRSFRVFDIIVDGRVVDYDEMHSLLIRHASYVEAEQFANWYRLTPVPEIYRGPYSDEIVQQYTSGQSVASHTSQIREGVVVRPVKERYEGRLGRVILKSVSPAYLTRKNGTEYN